MFRPSSGEWFILDRYSGLTRQQWGLPGDIPMPRDYDGDGRIDIAIFRPSTGEWYVIVPWTTGGYYRIQWGLPIDVPIR